MVRFFVLFQGKKNKSEFFKDFSQILLNTTKLKIPPETPTNITHKIVDSSNFGSASNQNIEKVYLYTNSIDHNPFGDIPNLMSLHLRLFQAERLIIRFNHLTNLKELCLEFKGCHPRKHNYFAFLPTSLEKLSIIGHDIKLNSLSY